tara:strand:- start:144 stop:314 length:171 start_codon:yes stop_codon:yes gene_type:complete
MALPSLPIDKQFFIVCIASLLLIMFIFEQLSYITSTAYSGASKGVDKASNLIVRST